MENAEFDRVYDVGPPPPPARVELRPEPYSRRQIYVGRRMPIRIRTRLVTMLAEIIRRMPDAPDMSTRELQEETAAHLLNRAPQRDLEWYLTLTPCTRWRLVYNALERADPPLWPGARELGVKMMGPRYTPFVRQQRFWSGDEYRVKSLHAMKQAMTVRK